MRFPEVRDIHHRALLITSTTSPASHIVIIRAYILIIHPKHHGPLRGARQQHRQRKNNAHQETSRQTIDRTPVDHTSMFISVRGKPTKMTILKIKPMPMRRDFRLRIRLFIATHLCEPLLNTGLPVWQQVGSQIATAVRPLPSIPLTGQVLPCRKAPWALLTTIRVANCTMIRRGNAEAATENALTGIQSSGGNFLQVASGQACQSPTFSLMCKFNSEQQP